MDLHWIWLLALSVPGSALGGFLRYLLSGWVGRRWGKGFPAGTLVVNVSGAFSIGVVWALPWREISGNSGELAAVFLMYGLLGGYTTVSSFSLQTLRLAQEGEWRAAIGNVAASFGLCLAAVFLGAGMVHLVHSN